MSWISATGFTPKLQRSRQFPIGVDAFVAVGQQSSSSPLRRRERVTVVEMGDGIVQRRSYRSNYGCARAYNTLGNPAMILARSATGTALSPPQEEPMNANSDRLSTARRLAAHHHDGQVDEAGQPYLGHIERVTDSVSHLEPQVVRVNRK